MNNAISSPTLKKTAAVNRTANPQGEERLNGASHLSVEEELQGTEPPRRGKISLRQAMIAGLLIFGLLGAAKLAQFWWTTARFIQQTDNAYIGGDLTVIAPKVAGFVARLAVRDNE